MAIGQAPINLEFGAKTQANEVMAGRDLSGETVIMAGGYSGFGLETAKTLAYAGARVIATARRPGVAKEVLLGLDEAEAQVFDLVELAYVCWFADVSSASRHRADITINNIDVMACPEARADPDWEVQFAINHPGHYALVNLLWPSLVDDARVVTVPPIRHHYSVIRWDDVQLERDYDKWLAYAQSETVDTLFAIQSDVLGRERGVHTFVLHPGSTVTSLQRHASRAEMIALGWMGEVSNPASSDTLKIPQQGAATQLWAATSPLPAGMGGLYCEDCNIIDVILDNSHTPTGVREHAINSGQARRLWRLSATLTGIDAFAS